MLLSGCCAVSETPAVCVWKRISHDFGFLRAERLPELARPDPARRAVLGDLLEEVDVRVEEEAQARREVVDVHPARDLLLDVGQAVLERERELLRGRRARLADVVAARSRPGASAACAPCTTASCRPSSRIAGSTGKHHSFWAMYSLRMSAWIVPLRRSARDPLLLGRDDVEGHHDRRRRVDRHRDADLAEVDPLRTASPCRRACRPRRPRARPRRATRGWSESWPISDGMSNAVDSPVWPWSSR